MSNSKNNELIAVFLGWIFAPNDKRFEDWFDLTGIRRTFGNKEKLRFDSDWNWLMEAVEKIESLNMNFSILNKASSIDNYEKMFVDLSGNNYKSKIESVYSAVILFIEIYNKSKELMQVCQCNNCNRFLIDENHQVDTPLVEISKTALHSMEWIENDEEGGFWGCPHCKTDAYLKDITKIE